MSTTPNPSTLPAAELRHNLRTPINHVLGYTEMLLEDAGSLGLAEVVGELEQVRAASRALLAEINERLAGRETVAPADLEALCASLCHPARRIVDLAASVERRSRDLAPEEWTHDVTKIRAGAETLLAILGETPAPERAVSLEPPPAPGHARILVVDDNTANRAMLRRRLERQGYAVDEAADGRAALDTLRSAPYDLVLLDIVMPEIDGFQVLAWMKEDAALRDVPVIVISALDEIASAVRSIEMGAEDFLFKPFDPVLLRARIGASLEKKRLRSELVVQEKLASLGALTAGVAHEIRNPLNFVNNFAQLAVEQAAELKEALAAVPELADLACDLEQNVRKVREHGARAESVVRSMLLHARGHSGERRPTDLNALVAETVNLAWHGARAENPEFQARIETALDPAAGTVNLVPRDISRVILNIAANAFYSLREKSARAPAFAPTLHVSTRAHGESVEICVRDNGTGIASDHLPRIFDPFFTTKPAGEGTGLGLSLSYEIVVQGHEGEIRAESREGEGAAFTVTLPKGPHD